MDGIDSELRRVIFVYDCPKPGRVAYYADHTWRISMGLVQVTHSQGRIPITIFRLQDRISLENFAELEATAKSAYANGMRNAVLDLSNTSSLTSIGVRAIIVIHKMLASDRDKHLKLSGPTPEIRDMLDISGVTEYIEVHDTVEAAVASF
jgi:anti-anti-sigma factor